jgi:hypothetical protein
MLLELRFSVWTLGLTAGTFLAALYGMNLKNWIEEHDLGFWGVSATCAVVSVVVLAYGLQKLRSVQRVSMWGNSSTGVGASNMKYLSPGRGGQALHEMWADERAGGSFSGGGLKGHIQNLKVHQKEIQRQIEQSRRAAEKESAGQSRGPLWEKKRNEDDKL